MRPRKLYLGLLLSTLAALFAGASLAQQFRRPPLDAPIVLRAPDPRYDPFGPGPREIHEAPADPLSIAQPHASWRPDGRGGWASVPDDGQPELQRPYTAPSASPPPNRIEPSPNSYGGVFHSR